MKSVLISSSNIKEEGQSASQHCTWIKPKHSLLHAMDLALREEQECLSSNRAGNSEIIKNINLMWDKRGEEKGC